MLIDEFQADWLAFLAERDATLPVGAGLMLLLDGAFVPGLFRQLDNGCRLVLLFESLNGCSEETRDVSPFIVRFDPANRSLLDVLSRCSGWPMVSAIVTYDTAEQLGARLAAWCIIEADGQRFNFRFPDTRRLPEIFDVLEGPQRAAFAGHVVSWDFIGRDGRWRSLPIVGYVCAAEMQGPPRLNERQFAALVADSEADEVWVQLLDRGAQTPLSPSQRHAMLSSALRVADKAEIDTMAKLDWCATCLDISDVNDGEALQARFGRWVQEQMRTDNEALHRTA